MMNRSFDRRVESLFLISDPRLVKETVNILRYNLMDTPNSYHLNEDGDYFKPENADEGFNIHREFFKLTPEHLDELSKQSILDV